MAKVPGSIAVPSSATSDILQVSQQFSWLSSALNNWIAIVSAYLTPGQYLGTTTNDNATAGNVGEFVSAFLGAASAISLSTGMAADITTISLTAGDWEIEGMLGLVPGAGVSATYISGWVNSTSVTQPGLSTQSGRTDWIVTVTPSVTTNNMIIPTGRARFSLAATTTIYLSTTNTFTGGTLKGFGRIEARRVR